MLIGGSGSVGWGENVEGEGGEDGGGRRWGGWWKPHMEFVVCWESLSVILWWCAL